MTGGVGGERCLCLVVCCVGLVGFLVGGLRIV